MLYSPVTSRCKQAFAEVYDKGMECLFSFFLNEVKSKVLDDVCSYKYVIINMIYFYRK